MTLRFRPQFDVLEARDVPAAFSAALPDGSVISGSFSTPAGVDPAQSSQSLTLTDLAVTKGGVAYTTQPGASAQYQYGALVGVGGYANVGSDVIYLHGTTVQNGAYSAPLALDGADARDAFALPDGATGALSYAIPWY